MSWMQSKDAVRPRQVHNLTRMGGNKRNFRQKYPLWVSLRLNHLTQDCHTPILGLPFYCRLAFFIASPLDKQERWARRRGIPGGTALNDIDFRLIGRMSIAYVMALVTEVLRNSPLDFLDLLIVTSVAEANHKPLPGSDAANGLRGISRNAVSRRLNVPLETVRRRVANLIKQHVLVEQPDGLVFSSANQAGLGGNAELDALNYKMLKQLFRELKAKGVSLD